MIGKITDCIIVKSPGAGISYICEGIYLLGTRNEGKNMGKEKTIFKHDEEIGRDGAADLLRQLADRIEEGRVVLKRGKKKIKLKVPSAVELELKIENKKKGKKKSRKKLELELEWVDGGDDKGAFTLG